MSLTRRRLFTGMVEAPRNSEWISARGREAAMAGDTEVQMAAPVTRVIRISSNENPLGPGQHVVDAIVGKFPEAARYPLNATQKEGALIARAGAEVQRQERQHRPRAGLGRDPDPRRPGLHLADQAAGHRLAVVREPARHRQEDRHAGARSGLRREAEDRHRQDGRGVEGRRPGVLLQPEQPHRDGARQDRRRRHGQGDPGRLARHGHPASTRPTTTT